MAMGSKIRLDSEHRKDSWGFRAKEQREGGQWMKLTKMRHQEGGRDLVKLA